MKSISVLLATYNGERFLQQQLDSIARQTLLPTEMVIADDNSSDRTIEILEEFAKNAPFPIYIHKNERRLGYRANFIHGMAFCKSDLIALCDQDDIWHLEKLSAAEKSFEDPDVTLFFHGAWLIDADNKKVGVADIYPAPAYNPPLSVHNQFSPYGFSIIFDSTLKVFSDLWSRSIASGDANAPIAHDTWIYFLATIFGVVICSDQKLTDYRQHGGNAVGAINKNLFSRLRSQLENHGQEYANQACAMHMRAMILAESRERLSRVWRDRSLAGERKCQQLSDRLAARARLYGGAKMFERARIVFKLRHSGAYAHDGGFGLKSEAFAKDLMLGILLRKFLTQPPSCV